MFADTPPVILTVKICHDHQPIPSTHAWMNLQYPTYLNFYTHWCWDCFQLDKAFLKRMPRCSRWMAFVSGKWKKDSWAWRKLISNLHVWPIKSEGWRPLTNDSCSSTCIMLCTHLHACILRIALALANSPSLVQSFSRSKMSALW